MPVALTQTSDQTPNRIGFDRRRCVIVILQVVLALGVAVGAWWLLSPRQRTSESRIREILVPASILAAAVAIAMRHERHWAGPVRKLTTLLPEVRAGRAAIEELSQIGGGMHEVVPLVQELLHDIRLKKQEIMSMQREIQQRVAGRTDALERKIGALLQQAARDGLTGLYNRRMLEQLLPRLIERCRLEGIDLCALMIDIDYFKQLNDTLGHAAGDELLRNLGGVISSSLRECDLAVRYGGDEFVVLMPGAGTQAAQAMAGRLASLTDALARPLRVSNPPRLSIGMAHLSQIPSPTAEELIIAADRSLYDIKAARRSAPRPA